MKIVYCIAGTCHSGGMERVLANKANWLARNGHEVVIVTTDQNGKSPFFALDERIRTFDLGIGYEDNNGRPFINKLLKYPLKQFRHKRRLSRLLIELHADIVVSMFCNDASFITGISDGSKKILEIHFSRFKRLQYNRKGLWRLSDLLRSRRDLTVAAKFDKFIVLTHEDKLNWPGLHNIDVIPNSRTFSLDFPAPLTEKTVLAVGRLCYQKGFDDLIDIWEKVCRKVSGWTLCIVGQGDLEEELRTRIYERGLTDSVRILSARPEEMPTLYSHASVYAMTSRYEGLPMALLEAQAAGLPIVSFSCKCGPRDVVNDGEDGFLVAEGDMDGMAWRLTDLMLDSNLRRKMGAKAFENSKKFSEDAVMQQWKHLFSEVLQATE